MSTAKTAPAPHAATASSALRPLVEGAVPHVTAIRRDLHRHPELMFEERRTSAVVCRELEALGIEHKAGLAGGTGVLGFLPATRAPDSARRPPTRTVALRADMDALPIEEQTGAPHASTVRGVMHACGHDGHTSILLGAARVLSQLPDRPHHVMFIFQPAEEGGAGGEKMCRDGALAGSVLGTKVDVIYGLHGWPELPLGHVATRSGPLLASTDDFIVTIRGRGGHAAYPHLCIDPVVVAAHVITALQTIASRRVNPVDAVVVTVADLRAGSHANNIIADSATFNGTIRTLRDDTRALAEQEFKKIVAGVCESLGARAEIEWHVGYPSTRNDEGATERFRRIARETLGPQRYQEREHPTMGGEDFSFYGRHVPACFFFLGLKPEGGACPGLHTPKFDFNDAALPTGIEMMCRLATESL